MIRASAHWLRSSRERTNFTYDLTPLNRKYLAWWVADVCQTTPDKVSSLFAEIEADVDFFEHIAYFTRISPRAGFSDPAAKLGRRLGWYAITRLLRPSHIVETGTDKGLGACVFAAALLKNGEGRVTSIDVNSLSGFLIAGDYGKVVDRVIGSSVEVLPTLPAVDLFLHDSLHTYDYEMAELNSVRLAERGLALSDNSEFSLALSDWSESANRRFSYFAEDPLNHWYKGGGIGASLVIA